MWSLKTLMSIFSLVAIIVLTVGVSIPEIFLGDNLLMRFVFWNFIVSIPYSFVKAVYYLLSQEDEVEEWQWIVFSAIVYLGVSILLILVTVWR